MMSKVKIVGGFLWKKKQSFVNFVEQKFRWMQ